jgi:hypothetical protein
VIEPTRIIAGAVLVAALACSCGGRTADTGSEIRSPGEVAFRSSCKSCHSLPKPSKYTDIQWPSLVARYGERAKLADSTIDLIIGYLTAHN